MKGVKTSTSLQSGDIITVKANGIVYSYAGETGSTDADTAYAGDLLGVVQKIDGSRVVYKGNDGVVRNSISIGDMNFAANPDFEYSPTGSSSGTGGTNGTDNRTVIEKGLDAFLKIFSIFSSSNSGSTSNNNSSGDGGTGGTDSGNGGGDNGGGDDKEKTFFEQYGLYGLLLLVIGIVIALIAKKPKQVPQQNVYQPSQFPPQYNAVRV